MEIYNGMKFKNAKGFWWEVVDCSVSRKVVVRSLEWMPYTTTVRKESVQKGVVMYPYGKSRYGGYKGEGKWELSNKNPHYSLWAGVLIRTKDEEFKNKNKAYIGVDIADEWLCLQNFCNWCEDNKPKHDHLKWELDKDLLGDGNLYSPSTCCFLPKEVNLFLSKRDAEPIYEYECKDGSIKYRVWVREGSEQTGNHYVGSYSSREEALAVWKGIKNERLQSLINTYAHLLPAHVVEALSRLHKK